MCRLYSPPGEEQSADASSPLLQLIQSLPQVEACAVAPCDGSGLLAFAVASTAGDRSGDRSAAGRREDGALSRLILRQLSPLLPPHSVPDALLLVPALSLTRHGEQRTHGDALRPPSPPPVSLILTCVSRQVKWTCGRS